MTSPPQAHVRNAVTAAAYGLSFDPDAPPVEPPAGCRDPHRWRSAHAIHRAHAPNPYGRCARTVCAEPSPCAVRRLALRGLIDAYLADGEHVPLPGPGRIITAAWCRWCEAPIELHSRFGWFHTSEGFLLCRRPTPVGLPLCRAQPAEQGSSASPANFWADQPAADLSRSATYTPTPGTP